MAVSRSKRGPGRAVIGEGRREVEKKRNLYTHLVSIAIDQITETMAGRSHVVGFEQRCRCRRVAIEKGTRRE